MPVLKSLAFAALLASAALPALAIQELTPEPGWRYGVVDVAPDDQLNIRAFPGAGSEIIGTLAPDATDIAVAGTRMEQDGSVWWQVLAPEGTGWVNARYLTPVDVETPPEEIFPLRCVGTEPFWALETADGEAEFSMPEHAESWTAGALTPAIGLVGRYAVRLESAEGLGHLSAWRNYGFCSDGMSDTGFPFEAILAAPGGSVYGGCCARAAP